MNTCETVVQWKKQASPSSQWVCQILVCTNRSQCNWQRPVWESTSCISEVWRT